MNRQVLPDPNVSVTQQYKKLECVGRGAYGSVHKGIFIPTGEVVALKIINLDGQDDDVEAIQKEVALLSTLRGNDSTNITRYHGCWLEGPHVWIVMDFAQGGSVRTLAKAAPNNSIEEKFTGVIMREVLQALAFLHRNNVIHRDLKAANVLISSDGRVMLCDFGVSALLATPHSKRSTFVGTPQWMAPEVILGQPYDTKADIWGLGITLYEMATGAPPHADQDHMRALMLIPKLKPPKLPDSTDASKEMREFMALCLREVPGDRLSAEELAKSKWIKSSKASVAILKELLNRYESWTNKGGVRASLTSPFGAIDPDEEPQDFLQPQSWEFDTVRAGSFIDRTLVPKSGLNENLQPVDVSALSNPPRSLRMLFEDAFNPGSDPFRVNAPRQNPGMPTASSASTISTMVSLNSSSSGNDSNSTASTDPNISLSLLTLKSPEISVEGAESDSSNTASSVGALRRQPQKLSFSGSMGLPRSPRPLASDSGAESASDKASTLGPSPSEPNSATMSPPRPSYREVRHSKGLADISIPPAVGSGVGVVQLAESPGIADTDREQKEESDGLGKGQRRDKEADSQHGQGSGSGSSLPSINGMNLSNSKPARERPPRVKRNATVGSPTDFRFGVAPPDGGLVPPQAASNHGASRSLDSRSGGVSGFGSGAGALGASAPLGTKQGSGGLISRPAPLGRQASAMAVLEGAGRAALGGLAVPGRNGPGLSPAPTGTVLKDLLKVIEQTAPEPQLFMSLALVQLSPVQPGSLGAGADMLPPSPGIGSISISPNKPFSYSPSALQTSITPTDAGLGAGNNSPLNGLNGHRGYPHIGGHSQSNSNSTTNQMTPHSNANVPLHPDNPELPPLDLGSLVSAEDVHAELARTVDGLMTWLGVVENGLGGVLGLGEVDGSQAGTEVAEGFGFELDRESLVGAG
ncbi:hypothetical protein CTheo_3453 [Ceratobasidium theobromae]|uniref:non-specific serine/threonine protein kinase n=1 Tax=Ceratobasidium theobromae TaxID=1582974 RepID=A0A5N5QNG6_9AGAM|nr:hypothetical protein CTheo_3453 [Ceratobasidium theobromae]